MIVFLGTVVGFIVAGMFLPMFSIIGHLSGQKPALGTTGRLRAFADHVGGCPFFVDVPDRTISLRYRHRAANAGARSARTGDARAAVPSGARRCGAAGERRVRRGAG